MTPPAARKRVGRASASNAVSIEIAWRAGRALDADALLRRAAARALHVTRLRSGALSIAVVGRRAMAVLHFKSLRVPGPTDVLTFDLGTDRRRGVVDGEVVVCSDVAAAAARTAKRRSAGAGSACGARPNAIAAELALYVVHGVLHLAGYDDQRRTDFERMHRLEDEILVALGLGPVFASG